MDFHMVSVYQTQPCHDPAPPKNKRGVRAQPTGYKYGTPDGVQGASSTLYPLRPFLLDGIRPRRDSPVSRNPTMKLKNHAVTRVFLPALAFALACTSLCSLPAQ